MLVLGRPNNRLSAQTQVATWAWSGSRAKTCSLCRHSVPTLALGSESWPRRPWEPERSPLSNRLASIAIRYEGT